MPRHESYGFWKQGDRLDRLAEFYRRKIPLKVIAEFFGKTPNQVACAAKNYGIGSRQHQKDMNRRSLDPVEKSIFDTGAIQGQNCRQIHARLEFAGFKMSARNVHTILREHPDIDPEARDHWIGKWSNSSPNSSRRHEKIRERKRLEAEKRRRQKGVQPRKYKCNPSKNSSSKTATS